MTRFYYWLRFAIISLFIITFISQSNVFEPDRKDRVRAYTRMVEFDYVGWTLDAFVSKFNQASLATSQFLTNHQNEQQVRDCMALVSTLDQVNNQIDIIYADPSIRKPEEAGHSLIIRRDELKQQQALIQPICEEIIEQQIVSVLDDWQLTTLGQTIPPVLYHVTPLPYALITSPRNVITQEQNISLEHGLTPEEITRIEKNVENALDVSALVVPIGGVGVYPTMVLSTSDLTWQIKTVAHEWTHNYLTMRPLGLNYETTPELRTMNETTAEITGKEVGEEVIKRFYPELVPQPAPVEEPTTEPPQVAQPTAAPPKFNYNKEMHTTRITADHLLSEGKIEEAETYMEQRRQLMWQHGYQIRRLNQAYFAFYGAYADVPGGAAGNDPVGPAVVKLRAMSGSLADFLNRISGMTSFDELKKAVGES